MKIIQGHRSFHFQPAFLDKMTGIQLQSWVEAAEEILRDHDIVYDKIVEGGHLSFQLQSEDDYRTMCNLSMDIGMRALRIESKHTGVADTPLKDIKTAGNA